MVEGVQQGPVLVGTFFGPCMRESSCSLGGGVDSSNPQFPWQTDRGQDTGGRHPTASVSASR